MPEITPSELARNGVRKQNPSKSRAWIFFGAPGEGELFMFTDPFNTLSIFDKAATIALYLTAILLLVGIVIGILVKKFSPQYTHAFSKTAFSLAIGYAIGLSSMLLFLKFDESDVDYVTFIPIVCLIGIALVLAIIGIIISIFNKEKFKSFSKIAAVIISASLLAVIISQIVNYYTENNNIDSLKEAQLYIYTLIIIVAIILIVIFFGKSNTTANKTKVISYGAVCASLSFALSYIRFLELPQGGSITFASLIPLMIYSYMFGIRRGTLLGAIYGLLQFIQAPWLVHPVQFLLDYPIAFAAVGISGLFKELNIFKNKLPLQFVLGAIIAVIIRYLSHVISGIFVWGSGNPNYGAVSWSFLYNSFTFADMGICLIVGCSLFLSKSFIRILDNNK